MPIEVTTILAFAIILSAFCAILGQRSKLSSPILVQILIVSGLGLGTLLTPLPINRYFLVGVLGFAAYLLFQSHCRATTKTMSLAQIALAILLVLVSSFSDHSLAMFAGLGLGFTLLPLFPFHLPFVSLVSSAHGAMSGLWVTVFLSLGLAELTELPTFLSEGMPSAVSWLALGSALYASLKCLGQTQIRPLLTYATIAQASMLWGLTTVFSIFSEWVISFGLTIAFVMTALLFTYHCIQQRFGSHALGTLPGLALVMPRLGVCLIILISFAVLLPLVPVLSGLPALPTANNQDVCLVILCFIIFVVWIFESWYFPHLMHQTAFGKARPDIPYSDLTAGEISGLTLLIAAASYHGLFY
ncbi:MAG: proton-conducting transporter membrane subunit [Nitrospirota bacterium]|nr:proton-conducting transporter membrane subunit [Nitrospirota bacterium]MDH5586182.1 proton-conducting transporter membrane subunit [Nitrospirota bacterium]MDH5773609.1 proton-conducting transporter membrane subunit [Nitrospirota bacterium]